jgi:hypothetical protein
VNASSVSTTKRRFVTVSRVNGYARSGPRSSCGKVAVMSLFPRDWEGGTIECIVGIDPGETTGLCGIRLGGGRNLRERVLSGMVFEGELPVARSIWGTLLLDEAAFVRSLAGRLGSLCEAWHADVLTLAIEDFILQERTQARSLLSPVRLTSGLLALLNDDDEYNYFIVTNSANDAKHIVTDDVLKSHDLYFVGKPHARDAARHALLHLRKSGA